jgi:hypothetical protein
LNDQEDDENKESPQLNTFEYFLKCKLDRSQLKKRRASHSDELNNPYSFQKMKLRTKRQKTCEANGVADSQNENISNADQVNPNADQVNPNPDQVNPNVDQEMLSPDQVNSNVDQINSN